MTVLRYGGEVAWWVGCRYRGDYFVREYLSFGDGWYEFGVGGRAWQRGRILAGRSLSVDLVSCSGPGRARSVVSLLSAGGVGEGCFRGVGSLG